MDVVNLMEHISKRDRGDLQGGLRPPRRLVDAGGRNVVIRALRHYASCPDVGPELRIEAASLAELLERR